MILIAHIDSVYYQIGQMCSEVVSHDQDGILTWLVHSHAAG